MIIVDDRLALLAIAGALPDLGHPGRSGRRTAFTSAWAARRGRSHSGGTFSRRLENAPAALTRVLRPPPDRLVVLDPRASLDEAVHVGIEHGANLLLAELVGAAVHHYAAVRVTPGNEGRTWAAVMATNAVAFATVDG